MSLKKLLVIISAVIIVLFGLMLTTSYAWYSFENASTTFDVVTNDDDIIVNYQTGDYINATNAVPIKSTEVDKYSDKSNFSVTVKDNKENNEMLVTVSLVDISIDGSLQTANFKVELYHQNTRVSTFGGNTIGTSGTTTKELGTVTLNDDVTNNFELRVYILDDDTDQSSMMNKTFQAKIKVDVVSRLKSTIKDYSNPDIYVSSITIDGETSNSLPTSGYYNMSSSCAKGSDLSWDPTSKTITYNSGSYINDTCILTFTKNINYPLLNTMPVGSYVAYTGSGGMVGNKKVSCQIGGNASSSTASAETEAPNSCSGQNAREDLDTSGYTYGYCSRTHDKYYTTGWRIAYIKDNKPIIVSAGSPECNTRTSSTANVTYIETANAKALKYCNTKYVDGNCTCADSNRDGLCDDVSTDAWAINDTDFYYMTKAISGYGKRLTSGSSSLGDSGGALGNGLSCYQQYSYQECGYNNDLIDNGGFYWFAAQDSSTSTNGVYWDKVSRYIYSYSSTDAYGLRPVISLSSSVYVTGGSGTIDDPYTIGI